MALREFKMFFNRIINYSILIVSMSCVLISCQSVKPLPEGIQDGFEAVNPASIIAVPVFMLPDPSKSSSIDPAIVISEQIVTKLQNKVIQSFNDQPNINGYPFSAVAKGIGTAKPNIWDNLDESMKAVAARFNSRDSAERSLITSSCLSRKNFMEFYSFCLSTNSKWISGLNALAARVMNADTALIAVITDIDSSVVDEQYKIFGSFSVLLVDTNNGKLIWGRDGYSSLINSPDKKYFPSWDELINNVFSEDFWDGFPGRILNKKIK